MSKELLLRKGAIAALGIAGLTLSACANGHHSNRYADIYSYESGGACGHSECSGAVYQGADYGHQYYEQVPAPSSTGVVYADCGQIDMMDCGYGTQTMTETYVEPAPTITECPAGTYMGSDGFCTSGSTTTGYYDSSTTTTTSTYSGNVDCPAGTTLQPDNTCLQSGSSYSSTTTTSTYTAPTTTSCPAGTVMSGDGTCMQSTTTHGGYTSSGGYTTSDYLPIRK